MWAIVDSMVTKFVPSTEQGTAFGINNAYREVSKIVGPFSFGALYSISSEQWDMPFLFILIGIALCVASMLIAIVPLHRSMMRPSEMETAAHTGKQEEAVTADTLTMPQLELSLATNDGGDDK